MEGRIQDAMPCSEFEQLLTDALDGALGAAELTRFEAHKGACPVCRLMFAEAHAGMDWLHAMPEAEPPARLMRNILAATSGEVAAEAAEAKRPGMIDRLRDWARPYMAPVMQPRFAMSAATAFFSVTLVLNVIGFRVSDLHGKDLRPSSLMANLAEAADETQGRVLKYYENLRFVYEIETRVRQLKNATEQNAQPADEKQKKQNNDTSGQPDRERHEERYSLGFGEGILASVAAPWNSDAVLTVLDRRNP